MKNERFLLLILAVVQFSHIIDFMIIMPLGAQFMEIFDISPRQFSWIVSVYAGTAFFAGLLGATIIDRFDRKTVLMFTYIGFTIGTFACSFANDYLFFLIARGLTGAFGGILSALVFAIIADTIPYERRSAAMGIVMTAFSFASVVGVPLGIYLATTFTWRVPFTSVAAVSALFCTLIFFVFPSMKGHLENGSAKEPPIRVLGKIFQDDNQLRALGFSVVLMFGHFTIIPFIAPYMQLNIGFSDFQITYIYLIGGILTIFLLPFFGRLADRYGNARIFTISSVFALFSIFIITNLPEVSMIIALCATSSFFVVASGRNVPATTMVTSVVKSESRGSFMTVRTSANEMALALSSFIAGLIITEDASGALQNYAYVGYIAIIMSLLAIVIARQLKPVKEELSS